MEQHNAIYIMGGGGTAVVSASASGLIERIYKEYRDQVGTFLAAVGGMRAALHEDITDVFKWIESGTEPEFNLRRIKFPASPVFGTSRYNPDKQDCKRLIDVFKARNIHYVFLNGGNDTMEKAVILEQYAKEDDWELHIIGIPKTIDNDLLITHRCPGYATFAKQVALNTRSLDDDLASFSIPDGSVREGPIRECAVAQVLALMGRDQGWGAAASVIAKLEEKYGPHIILTKEGKFDKQAFVDKCQKTWDKHHRLMVVAAEGAFNGDDYLANQLQVLSYQHGLMFETHEDPHKNTSVTDSRVALFLKLLIEQGLKAHVDAQTYSSFKCREEGPGYRDRSQVEILSAVDFADAAAVGARAADLAFSEGRDGVMVTLTDKPGETDYTKLENVGDPKKGSRHMVKSIRALDSATDEVISHDGMMINRKLFMGYIGPFLDMDGPNRSQLLGPQGYSTMLKRIKWPLEKRLLAPYEK